MYVELFIYEILRNIPTSVCAVYKAKKKKKQDASPADDLVLTGMTSVFRPQAQSQSTEDRSNEF